ncbi:MAG: tetratricopeptide repeat-containing diguanylate cyclase [Burkholderiales bacterium]
MVRPREVAPSLARAFWAKLVPLFLAVSCVTVAHAEDDWTRKARALEPSLAGFPHRTVSELAALLARSEGAPAADRVLLHAMYGQALVAAGRNADAAALADRVDEEARRTHDPRQLAVASLIRGTIELSAGDTSTAMTHAREARELAVQSGDADVRYWAALTAATLARARGLTEEAMTHLQDAQALAESADDAYRRSSVLYQLAVLQTALKNAPAAQAASVAAYKHGEAAQSAYAMANARMAESAAMELLQRPAREMAAMEEALAIARSSGSKVAEARALVNLADIRLRRRQYATALDLARRSLDLSRALGDTGAAATSMANVGFALLGLGRIAEGKQYAERALAEYERTNATADTAELIAEYARYLEQLGDYPGALVLYHRERKLNEEIAVQTRQRALVEMQEKYESERHHREIEFLNRENELKSHEIEHRVMLQRVWWLVAGLFAILFFVVAWLYRKLRLSSNLLAQKNAELSVQSSRDPLTGLYNRRYFQEFIAAQGAHPGQRRREDDATSRALFLIDVDHFKETNDRFGHAIGDTVLVAVAARLRDALRDTDMVVRWGGEEFLVYATARADRVDDIAARILSSVSARAIVVQDKVVRTTVSMGYMTLPLANSSELLSWDRALGLVDMALYMAKTGGRNRAFGLQRLVHDDPESLAAAERDLENACKQGLVEVQVLYGQFPSKAGVEPVGEPSNDDLAGERPIAAG